MKLNLRSYSEGEAAMNSATKKCVVPLFRTPNEYQAYRISPEATNRLAIVFDPLISHLSLTYCIEIFDMGGKTPPIGIKLQWKCSSSSREKAELPATARRWTFALEIVSWCRQPELI